LKIKSLYYPLVTKLVVLLVSLGPLASSATPPAENSGTQDKEIHFTCTGRPNESGYQFVEKLYQRAFASLGYKFSMSHAPRQHALKLLRTEQADGDCGRVATFEELTGLTNTLLLKQAYRTVQFSAWHNPKQVISEDRSQIHVGYQHDSIFIPHYLADMGYTKITSFNDNQDLIKALADQKIDLIMHYNAAMINARKYYPEIDIKYHSHILSLPMHGILLKKHAHLADALSTFIARFTARSPYRPPTSMPTPASPSEFTQLKFSCPIPSDNTYFQLIEKAFNKSFHQMGYHINLVSMSRAREIAELRQGNIDGSCGRTRLLGESLKDQMIVIEAPTTPMRLQIWGTTPNLNIQSFSKIPEGSRIAAERGTAALLPHLKQHFPLTLEYASAKSGLTALSHGKIDFYIDIPESIGINLQRVNSQIPIYLNGEIKGPNVYPLLHVRHKFLQPQLTELLRNQAQTKNQDFLIQLQE
jgi:hypothetical protein